MKNIASQQDGVLKNVQKKMNQTEEELKDMKANMEGNMKASSSKFDDDDDDKEMERKKMYLVSGKYMYV